MGGGESLNLWPHLNARSGQHLGSLVNSLHHSLWLCFTLSPAPLAFDTLSLHFFFFFLNLVGDFWMKLIQANAFFLNYYLFIHFFLAVLGLRLCARASPSCSKWGPLFIAVRGPLTVVASLVAEHRLQTRRLSNCGSRAQPLRGMWDPPRPGPEPVSPALADRLPTTAPPGKPLPSL